MLGDVVYKALQVLNEIGEDPTTNLTPATPCNTEETPSVISEDMEIDKDLQYKLTAWLYRGTNL